MTVALVISSAGNRYYAILALPPNATSGHLGVLRCECQGYLHRRKCKHISALLGEPSTVPNKNVKWTSDGKRLFKRAKEAVLFSSKSLHTGKEPYTVRTRKTENTK